MVEQHLIIYKGTESLKLNIDRKKFRESIDKKPIEFKKTVWSKISSEDYGLFHVFYDDNDLVDAIEFFNEIEVFLNENNLMKISRIEAREIIKSNDINFIEDDFGIISKKLSIAICCPTDIVESVLVGRENYFDKFEEIEEDEEDVFDIEGIDYTGEKIIFEIKNKSKLI